MSNNVYQLSPLTCTRCGMPGVSPRTSVQYNKYTKETITEAVWTCHRCNSTFNIGEISRETSNEKTEKNS